MAKKQKKAVTKKKQSAAARKSTTKNVTSKLKPAKKTNNSDMRKTKDKLIDELAKLRRKVVRLEKSAVKKRQIEESLEESKVLQAFINAIPDIVYFTDIKGRHLIVNKGHEDFIGKSKEEILGKTAEQLLPPDLARQCISSNKEVLETGKVVRCEETDGRITFESIKAPLTDKSGNVTGLIGVCRDMTELKHKERFLKQSYEELESIVRERTDELLLANDKLEKDIADRKEAEDRLRESEERYRMLFDSVNDAVLVHGIREDGRPDKFTASNDVACDLYGYSKEEFAEMTPGDINDPERAADPAPIVDKLLNEKHVLFETVDKKKDGTSMPVEISTHLFEFKGRPIMISAVRDITERKKVEKTLIESEARFRGAFENAAIGATMVDFKGRFLRVNSAFCGLLGYTEDEIMTKTFSDITHPEDMEIGINRLKSLAAGEYDRTTFEKRYICKDGRVIHTIISPSLIRDADGSPRHCVALVQDITERKQAEAELLRSEKEASERSRFIESIVNLSPDILYIYDIVEKKNIYSNNGIEKVLGYSPDEVLEMGESLLPTLMHPDDFSAYLSDTLPKYTDARDGEVIAHEYRMKSKAGEWRWLESNAMIYERQTNGVPRQILGVVHDVTERKHAEDSLKESEGRYRNLFEHSLEGIAISKGNQVISANKALLDIFGYYNIDEYLKISLLDHVAPESREFIRGRMEKRQKGEPLEPRFEYKIQRKDGEIRDIEISVGEIYFGKEMYTQGSFRDVTERKEAEDALKESQKLLETIVELTPT
jgi:PAS domain S-box-containing protein